MSRCDHQLDNLNVVNISLMDYKFNGENGVAMKSNECKQKI